MRSICISIVFFWMGALGSAMETPFAGRTSYASLRSRLFFLSARRERRPSGTNKAKVFDAIWKTARDDFFDPKKQGLDWNAIGKKYRPIAIGANDADAFEDIVNRMLG